MNNVLDLSSVEAGKLRIVTRPIFLQDVLLEVLGIMKVTSQQRQQEGKGATGVTCRLVVSESVPTGQVLADDTHIRQVRCFWSLGGCALHCRHFHISLFVGEGEEGEGGVMRG